VDQVADFKLEFNFEYRFNIISNLEGAVFCDIGNTFTLKDDPFRAHANFKLNDFYKLMAVGPGIGLRFDFSYFVIRLDAAYPLYDPALDGPYRQEIFDYYNAIDFEIPDKKIALSIAIGYPF
jgi:outer membrane protein insertion porin family